MPMLSSKMLHRRSLSGGLPLLVERLFAPHDFRAGPDHRVPGTGRPVRKLRQSAHHPGHRAATTFGALPLLFGSGAGWESRQPIGIVIVFGVAVSAVLTLFIVPSLHALFARTTSSPQHVSRLIEQMQKTVAADNRNGV